MRVEWALNGTTDGGAPEHGTVPAFDMEEFKAAFPTMAEELGMRWKLTSGGRRCGWPFFVLSICIAWRTCCTGGAPENWIARFR